MSLITDTYDSWKQCLTRNMGKELTLSFVRERVATLGSSAHAESKKYIETYGIERLKLVHSWFVQLEKEMS